MLYQDKNGNVVEVGKTFITQKVTLAAADTFEEATKPADALECVAKSTADFTIGESATADGFPTDDHTFGCAGADSIWLKGAAEQDIYLFWVLI